MGSDEYSPDQCDFEWEPDRYAVSFDRYQHPSGRGRVSILVSHPTAPFRATIAADTSWSDGLLQVIAYAYLGRLSATLEDFGHPAGIGLPQGWLAALDPDNPNEYFGWLKIARTEDTEFDGPGAPLSSYCLFRGSEGGSLEDAANKSVVLVAAETLPSSEDGHPTNSDFGVRVLMHLTSPAESSEPAPKQVSISALLAYPPYAPYRTLLELAARKGPAAATFAAMQAGIARQSRAEKETGRQQESDIPLKILFENLHDFFGQRDGAIADALQLDHGLTYQKLRFLELEGAPGEAGPLLVEVEGVGTSTPRSDGSAADVGFLAHLAGVTEEDASELDVQLVAKWPLVSDARPPAPGRARVFEQVPQTWRDRADLLAALAPYEWYERRPTRSDAELDRFRRMVDLDPGNNSADVSLETKDFVVRNCPDFVHGDPVNGNAKKVRLPAGRSPRVRTNDHSAIMAYWNCKTFFQTMRDLGLNLAAFFSAALPKVDVFYRSGIAGGPGKDGQTINAQVWVSLRQKKQFRFLTRVGFKIEIHMALGNHSHRARLKGRAEPLGISNSERWAWHEFGHVLIAARLAPQREFGFVHSAGDGMAAVWADPFSRFADPREGAAAARLRGYTFPWINATRRHDRCVLNGWSWRGTLHLPVIEAAAVRGPAATKGYLSEQILSSTLFRIYLSLGGETVDVEDRGPDFAVRQTASLACLYFLMRAIESINQPPVDVGDLELLMMQADVGLTTPLVLPLHNGANYRWQGGMAHKVIRWAFEGQGLHWPLDPLPHNAPGPPPDVDIYIPDDRPTDEPTEGGPVAHAPGGYVPVSLDWAGAPRWQMVGTGQPPGNQPVKVRNRGSQTAAAVSLHAWVGYVAGDPAVRDWDRTEDITWHPRAALAPAAQDIAAGGEADFVLQGPLPAPPPQAVWQILLYEATCAGDRANSDPAAQLPCAVNSVPPRRPRQVADLVASDNNLGLRMHRLSA